MAEEKKPEKWQQSVTAAMKRRGTKGSLTRIAHAHGESPMTFAHEHYHSPGKIGQKSRYAVNAQK